MSGYYAGDNFCRKKGISYIAISETGQAKALHMLNRIKVLTKSMDQSGSLNHFFYHLFVTHFTLNKGTGDPICKQCKVSLN
jgi:hypothetical protein